MELIDSTIQLIQEKGWVRGAAHTRQGFCLVGAMHTVWCNTGEGEDELHVAMLAVIAVLGRVDVTIWNDHEARDVDHVLEVLKLANERADLEARTWT